MDTLGIYHAFADSTLYMHIYVQSGTYAGISHIMAFLPCAYARNLTVFESIPLTKLTSESEGFFIIFKQATHHLSWWSRNATF